MVPLTCHNSKHVNCYGIILKCDNTRHNPFSLTIFMYQYFLMSSSVIKLQIKLFYFQQFRHQQQACWLSTHGNTQSALLEKAIKYIKLRILLGRRRGLKDKSKVKISNCLIAHTMIYKQSEYGYKETIIMVTFYMEISTVGHVIKPAKPRMALKRFDHVPTVIIPPSGEATNIFGL